MKHLPVAPTLGAAIIAASLLLPSLARPLGPSVEVEHMLEREGATADKMERRVLRREIDHAERYRVLKALYVLRAPSLDVWEHDLAPALDRALGSDRPLEELRLALLGFDDALLAGPDISGFRVQFELPAERGEGFFAVVAPSIIGPDGGLTNHLEPNKFRVLSGVEVGPVDRGDEPVIETLALKSSPDAYTGDRVRSGKLNELPHRGRGAWAKFKGRSLDDPEEVGKMAEAVRRVGSRDRIEADRMRVWPGSSGDSERVRDLLQSARYESRTLRTSGGLVDTLRRDSLDWSFDETSLKHPVRFGVATFPLAAELDEGDGVELRTELVAFVFLYAPLFIDFDAAHLYAGTSPEFLARSVQRGELPFFERGGRVQFYLGHLDRWIDGRDLEPRGGYDEARAVPELVDRWGKDLSPKDQRTLQSVGKRAENWPVRMRRVEGDTERYQPVIYHGDLATWLRRFESSLRPDVEWMDADWSLVQRDEVIHASLGVALQRVDSTLLAEVPQDAVAEVVDPEAQRREEEMRRREAAGLSAQQLAHIEESRAAGERRRTERANERQEEDAVRVEARLREAERERQDEERRRAQREALERQDRPITVRLRDVVVGDPSAGGPYLATRPGRSLKVEVGYTVEGSAEGHKLAVVSQAYDRNGDPIAEFVSRSSEVTLREGEHSIDSFVKVPSSFTEAAQQRGYRVVTTLELDGVPLRGGREEFVQVGEPLHLHRVELDPSVVVPGEEASLLMDLALGGWAPGTDITMQARVEYTVGDTTVSDSFPLTRGVGFHALEVDVDVPEGLPAGDGSYTVTLSGPDGASSKGGGTLRVFSKQLVEDGPESRQRRQRFDEEVDELAVMAEQSDGDRERRTTVRRTDREEAEDGLFTLDSEEQGERSKRDEPRRRRRSDDATEDELDLDVFDDEPEERRTEDRAREDAPADNFNDIEEEEPEEESLFDIEEMPETVFEADDSDEAVLWAEAEAMGVVRVYGRAAENMEGWLGDLQDATDAGAPGWIWIVKPSSKPGLLRFQRYSQRRNRWLTVWEMPTEWRSGDERREAKEMMQRVFDSYVPEQKRKVPSSLF